MIFLSPCRFQSTFPRGERHLCWLVAVKHIHFNPRSLVGNDVKTYSIQTQHLHFNPRSLVGNDPACPYLTINDLNFNPRSLVGNDGKFSQIFFVFLCNKYNFSTFYYPFSLFFSVIHVTFLIFVVRILPAFYVYF